MTESAKPSTNPETRTGSNNFITNFERNLNTDPVETRLEKGKRPETSLKSGNISSLKQTMFGNKDISQESKLNRITPRVNIDYNNFVSAFEPSKQRNLFQNYVNNKSEKSIPTPSFHNMNTEVSKSTNSYVLTSKPSLVKSGRDYILKRKSQWYSSGKHPEVDQATEVCSGR